MVGKGLNQQYHEEPLVSSASNFYLGVPKAPLGYSQPQCGCGTSHALDQGEKRDKRVATVA